MASNTLIPETRVLAIASHVVHGYVGNKMATFVMQSLGCDVSAINTVHYSNHTAYKQVKGTKTSAEQIQDLYEGLQQSNLNTFDLLLTGYMPSADAVRAVGKIGRDLKLNASTRPGSFFWVLDPVMGDNGKLYIPEDEVPQYKKLLREADLILPNQFEAETLSGTEISDLDSLAAAIQVLHKTYQVPHVIITSLLLTEDNQTFPPKTPSRGASRSASKATSTQGTPVKSRSPERNAESSHSSTLPTYSNGQPSPQPQLPPQVEKPKNLTIIGSTSTSDHRPRLFRIDTPQLPFFFSGTGDMFAALTVPRLLEAVRDVSSPDCDLTKQPSWRSPDDVPPEELPLAKAASKVLASMQAILVQTAKKCDESMKAYDARAEKEGCGSGGEDEEDREARRWRALMKNSEVIVPRHIKELTDPPNVEKFQARRVDAHPRTTQAHGEKRVGEEVGEREPNEFGVVKLGVGRENEGAMQIVGEETSRIWEQEPSDKGKPEA